MLREWLNTASSRDVLGNIPPHTLRSLSDRDFAAPGPRLMPGEGRSFASLEPRAVSRASGCKTPSRGKSLGPRGMYFPIHPSSRQCSDTFFSSCLSILAAVFHIDITTLEDSNVGTLRNISINIDMGVGYGFHIEQIDLLGSIVLVA